MSSWGEGRHTTQWYGGHRSGRTRAAALAGLLAAGLMLVPDLAGAADQGAPSGPQAGNPVNKVSPYARFTREHAQSADRKPNRARPSFSQGRAHGVNVHYKR